jgi:membrane associated rhomboid family serine protease
MRTTVGQIGPSKTPGIIRKIIIATSVATLVAALIDPLIFGQFGYGIQYHLSLSYAAINSMYVWQPLTYLFVLQPFGGVDFGLIISLFFQMFILWMMGSGIAEREGEQSFVKLYFGSGILAALITLLYYSTFTFSPATAGPTASLYSVFIVWTMLHRDAQIFLFFIIPVKAKWLLAGVLGASFLVFASQGAATSLLLLLTGTLYGYFYATVFKGASFPFEFLEPVDRFFIGLAEKPQRRKPKKKGPKVVKFPSGKPVETDDEFVDRMLEKISKKGRNSLTKEEDERLGEIAKRKNL